MLKVNITIEENEKNCIVKISQNGFEESTNNEKATYLNIYNHLQQLFNDANAKKTTTKKTTRKKKTEK